MKLIVLSGLVSIEKIGLALQIAHVFADAGVRVTLLDNIARLAVNTEQCGVPLIRVRGEMLEQLAAILSEIDSDMVVWAASEELAPDDLFAALDRLHIQLPDLQVQTFALIDLRTCDCFPHLREQLEQGADVALHMPYVLEDVLAYVDHTLC